MARDINFRTFKKLLKKKKLRKIVIDLDSRAVNVEGNQEGAVKGYHPGHAGKIIRTVRQPILKLLEGHPYQEVFK